MIYPDLGLYIVYASVKTNDKNEFIVVEVHFFQLLLLMIALMKRLEVIYSLLINA